METGKEWLSTQRQAIGKQMTCNPFKRIGTRNNAQSWWIALETTIGLEGCLKKFDRGISRKRLHWATPQKAEVNKLELINQLRWTWTNLLLEYFEDAMRAHSSALPLIANPFVKTAGKLMFT